MNQADVLAYKFLYCWFYLPQSRLSGDIKPVLEARSQHRKIVEEHRVLVSEAPEHSSMPPHHKQAVLHISRLYQA